MKGLIIIVGTAGLLIGCGTAKQTQNAPLARAILHVGENTSYDFGSVPVGEGREVQFVVRNAGSLPATEIEGDFYLSLNFSFTGGEYPGVGGTCGEALSPDTECVVEVGFAPQYDAEFRAAVELQYHDGIELRVTSQPILTGQGRAP